MKKSTTTRMMNFPVIVSFPENITPEQMSVMKQKAQVWIDPHANDNDDSRKIPTADEVEAELIMQGSFHKDREWVGIHFDNMIRMGYSCEQMKLAIAHRLDEMPRLLNGYTLFMKPFCKE